MSDLLNKLSVEGRDGLVLGVGHPSRETSEKTEIIDVLPDRLSSYLDSVRLFD